MKYDVGVVPLRMQRSPVIMVRETGHELQRLSQAGLWWSAKVHSILSRAFVKKRGEVVSCTILVCSQTYSALEAVSKQKLGRTQQIHAPGRASLVEAHCQTFSITANIGVLDNGECQSTLLQLDRPSSSRQV